MTLTAGFHDVPRGHIAAVVTHLEMRRPAAARRERAELRDRLHLRQVAEPPLDWYRALFRKVGEDWLWFGRLVMEDAELDAVLRHPDVHVYALLDGGIEAGLLELDFRAKGACELAYFGLTPGHVGSGAGRWLMNRAGELAWAGGIERFHVHTCSLDHPAALDFYRRSGFVPYRREIEVAPDPRLSGHLPETAGAHVPILR